MMESPWEGEERDEMGDWRGKGMMMGNWKVAVVVEARGLVGVAGTLH